MMVPFKGNILAIITFLLTVLHPTESFSAFTKTNPSQWFPTRIQEDVEYEKVVGSIYLRHIVVETKDMAQIVVQSYLKSTDEDPFGSIAKVLSACSQTRQDGGRIGWLDSRHPKDSLLPKDVFEQLWTIQPKSGDIHIIPSNYTQQIHVVKVEELLLNHWMTSTGRVTSQRVGAHYGKNALVSRSKLKGRGVSPSMPQNPKTYQIHTAGCQMNVADTERLAGVLEQQLGLAPSTSDPDVVIFNTCSIRDHAENKLYDMMGPYAAKKRQGDNLALIVTGCVAQQEGEALLRRVPEIDVVLGPQYIPHLKNVLESVEWGHQLVATSPMIHQDRDFAKPIRGHRIRAFVNVIMGCNEHCSYCVVPGTRGMEQSRPMEAILDECLELATNGYKEVTLLGQNIDAYGRDMTPKRNFADLLIYLNANLPEKIRIRYVTSHPRYFSDRVIDAVSELDKVCECFHVPFQAGDDEVLKRMRRGYTFDGYMKIIDKIKAKAPDAAICGDVIVGFPGETEEAFEKTLEIMRRVHFDNLNTFAYSPRPNTEAALFQNQIPEDVKSRRLQRVQSLAQEHALERSRRYVGRIVEVLVEDTNPRNPNQVFGRTRQGRQVFFNGVLTDLEGKLVNVKVTEARTWSLIGEIFAL
jgi:tRNA-2-methylthio-N6-dimethylallyladenosine synthase